ncbi:peptidoglycan editing factor PgeF [Rhodovulum sp. DZ06]|uniref:peptidoglycan editing factor PgeF n=1 Tax=Rhodovulum sp. DZ06 TaxID=3425126 RepID=UPI003D347867
MSLPTIPTDWLEDVRHGFFTREGGVSKSIYGTLNCGPGSDDDPEAVAENRARVAEAMGVLPGKLLTCRQVHSAKAVIVEEPWSAADRPEADAMVTDRGGLALCILTADCAPVLFHDPVAKVIGAAHAGWRGALGGVLEETINAMRALGARPDRIEAEVGPCISQRAYEVGEEFLDAFMAEDHEHSRFFAMGPRGKYVFDLPAFCLHRLREAGVDGCGWVRRCTYEDKGRFFSFRRATHFNERDYGRQASCIALPGYA